MTIFWVFIGASLGAFITATVWLYVSRHEALEGAAKDREHEERALDPASVVVWEQIESD